MLRGILIWSYERGTLQYDIICALILAFVFLTPRSCFESKRTETVQPLTGSAVGRTSTDLKDASSVSLPKKPR
jgi:hypothetical protein